MHYSKPVDTSIDKDLTLSLDEWPKTNNEKKRMKDVAYGSAVGSLMNAMLCIKSGICFAVGLICHYQSNL